MIQIDENELLESLRNGYKKLEIARSTNNKKEVQEIKGWCIAIEGIIFTFAPEYKDKVISIRESIITKTKIDVDASEKIWDTPTYLRKNIKV